MSHQSTEEQRLQQLRSYHILDTLSEKEYEDITFLAATICNAPIALISLVDKERQWFKSHHGLDATETHRDFSFCAHALNTPDEAFIVSDARQDERFKDNPLVIGYPGIVFYAGIPLINKQGFGLGTVCIIDNQPRQLSDKQVAAMRILAAQVVSLLETRKANRTLSIAMQGLEMEIEELDSMSQNLTTALNDQISTRIAEVAAERRQMQKINADLQAFNYISSHDLQEPLRKIQTFASYIEINEFDNLTEQGRSHFQKIDKAALRMNALLKDLLHYSRATETDQLFEPITVEQLATDAAEYFNEEMLAVDGTISVHQNGSIAIIYPQFKQLLFNLVSNSLRYMQPDVPPHITLSYGPADAVAIGKTQMLPAEGYCCITYTDNGVGFDNQYSEKIFELFQRLDVDGWQAGTGIGLAIVKKIAENHDGYVTAESPNDTGATFKIYLPVWNEG